MTSKYTAGLHSPNTLGNLIPLCLTSLCSPANVQTVRRLVQSSGNPAASCPSPVLWAYVQSCDGSEGVLCILCASRSGPKWLCLAGSPSDFSEDGFTRAGLLYPGGSEACFEPTGNIKQAVRNPALLNKNIIGEVVSKIESRVRPSGGYCMLERSLEGAGGESMYAKIYTATAPVVESLETLARAASRLPQLFAGLGSLLFGSKVEELFKTPLTVGSKEDMYTFALLVKVLCGDAGRLQCIASNPTLERRKLLLMLLF